VSIRGSDQKRDGFDIPRHFHRIQGSGEFPRGWGLPAFVQGDAETAIRSLKQTFGNGFLLASFDDQEFIAPMSSEAFEVIIHGHFRIWQCGLSGYDDSVLHQKKPCLKRDSPPASFVFKRRKGFQQVYKMSEAYEDPQILDEYLLFHFGRGNEILDPKVQYPEGMKQALDFAARTPSHFSKKPVAKGLDLGCAVGRSTFEMARHCQEVVGVDFSHRFIAAANLLKQEGKLGYSRLDEGLKKTSMTARLPEGIDSSRVKFMQADAMHLPADLGSFDRVHAANLLCRLSDPVLLLNRFGDLVARGGELVLATPCTWLETYTPRENWPRSNTFDWLREYLSETFDLRSECDEPFLIRETARKFQWTRSMITVWKRR
jgi:putative 4-mercaptohistidine N1-methyltranferase